MKAEFHFINLACKRSSNSFVISSCLAELRQNVKTLVRIKKQPSSDIQVVDVLRHYFDTL